jgi:hypothetical protein
MGASDLEKVLAAVNNVEPSPAAVKTFNMLVSEIKNNNTAQRLHHVHLAKLASAVYELRIVELYDMVEELMVEAGLFKTDDYASFPKFFKDASTGDVKHVSSYGFYTIAGKNKPILVKAGLIIDGEGSPYDVPVGFTSQNYRAYVTRGGGYFSHKITLFIMKMSAKVKQLFTKLKPVMLKVYVKIKPYLTFIRVYFVKTVKWVLDKTIAGLQKVRSKLG